MSKFKDAISGTWADVRDGFWRFLPFHAGAIALAICVILDNHVVIHGRSTCMDLMRGIAWGMLAGVFARLVSDRARFRFGALVSWGVTLIVAALGITFWSSMTESSRYYWVWSMLYGGSAFALVAACMAMLYDRDNENTLFSRVLFNLIVVYLSAALVTAGLSGCLVAFDSLIASIDDRLFGDQAAIVCLAAAPIVFMSLVAKLDATNSDSRRAGTFLFRRILPIAVILLAILYLYLFKILLKWTLPAGKLNWFGSIALAVYVFFWLAVGESGSKFTRFVIRRGWALLVPVVAAQVMAVWTRYNAYGLTAERMAGMITLGLGIYALVLAALNSRRVWFFRVMAVAGLIFTVSPLNFMDMPVRNQEHRLRDALERTGCLENGEFSIPDGLRVNDKEAKIIAGAWDYLGKAHAVWHKADFRKKISSAANGDLMDKLAIDRTNHRGYHGTSKYTTYTFLPDGDIPLEGYKAVRPREPYGVMIYVEKDMDGNERWKLSLSVHGSTNQHDAPRDTFDVTENIKVIFAAAGFPETTSCGNADDDKPCEAKIDPSLFRWELNSSMDFACGRIEVIRHDPDVYARCNAVSGFILIKQLSSN